MRDRGKRALGPGRRLAPCQELRGGIDGKQAGQGPEPPKGALLLGTEELITPGHGRIHRPLPFGQIARRHRREQPVVLEAPQQAVGVQRLDPRRRQFQRKRERVEPPADRNHGAPIRRRQVELRPHVPGPLDEQPHGWQPRHVFGQECLGGGGEGERPDGVFTLATKAQRRPAGHENLQRRNRHQQIAHERRRVEHVFEVVEYQQRRPILAGDAGPPGQIGDGDVGEPEAFGDRRSRQSSIARSSQRNEDHAGGFVGGRGPGDLQRKTRLPDAAGSDEGHEAQSAPIEPLAHHLQLGVAAEQRRQRHRQRRRAQFLGCGARRPPRTREKGVVTGAREIERGGERAQSLQLRPAPFAAFERAHGVHREARDRGELLLGEAGSFTQTFQVRAERTRTGFHGDADLTAAASFRLVGRTEMADGGDQRARIVGRANDDLQSSGCGLGDERIRTSQNSESTVRSILEMKRKPVPARWSQTFLAGTGGSG